MCGWAGWVGVGGGFFGCVRRRRLAGPVQHPMHLSYRLRALEGWQCHPKLFAERTVISNSMPTQPCLLLPLLTTLPLPAPALLRASPPSLLLRLGSCSDLGPRLKRAAI